MLIYKCTLFHARYGLGVCRVGACLAQTRAVVCRRPPWKNFRFSEFRIRKCVLYLNVYPGRQWLPEMPMHTHNNNAHWARTHNPTLRSACKFTARDRFNQLMTRFAVPPTLNITKQLQWTTWRTSCLCCLLIAEHTKIVCIQFKMQAAYRTESLRAFLSTPLTKFKMFKTKAWKINRQNDNKLEFPRLKLKYISVNETSMYSQSFLSCSRQTSECTGVARAMHAAAFDLDHCSFQHLS
jgi:hypothetical protein